MQGVIVKGIGGFYTVVSQNARYICRARGRFRLEGTTPMVGDNVRFEAEDVEDGYLLEVLPRRNSLVRPAVANVDQLVWVLSAGKPAVDRLLGDKLMLQAQCMSIKPLICINKIDAAAHDYVMKLVDDYASTGYITQCVSSRTKQGIETLREHLHGRTSCFAGQSAVGKTSLINALCPSFSLETGDMSKKTGRGRHTTRQVELLSLQGGGYIADTPGFSLLEMAEIDPGDVGALYPEFAPVLGNCRFAQCLHDSEPDCAVKAHLAHGDISAARYQSYIALLHECLEMKKHKYD